MAGATTNGWPGSTTALDFQGVEDVVIKAEQIVSKRPHRLIVPLDGSVAADRAVPVAREIARRFEIPVSIVHVFANMKQLNAAARGKIDWTDQAEPRAAIEPPASIRDAVSELNRAGVSVDIIGRIGPAEREILQERALYPDGWIVMTSLGSSGVRRLFLGSVARAVIRSASCPVLLVPSRDGGEAGGTTFSGQKIAVCVDGKTDVAPSICAAASVAEAFEMEIDLVRVAETFRDSPQEATEEEKRWELPARAEVEAYLGRVAQACVSVRATINQVCLSGSPDVQIMNYVRAEAPALVTISTRRLSGIERWTYGSMAEKLVDSLPVPLLLVPTTDSQT
jgi:nucleotide-binding universal stress UspA family protein